MASLPRQQDFYRALVDRDSDYEGVFFAGIKTTGIFCRPTCPARKPKAENCEYFPTAQDALLAGYRPCKRCQPLAPAHEASAVIKTLVGAVEADPERKWTDADFRALGVDSSTARRHFKQRFGMTFVGYARARRLGAALSQLRQGGKVIDAQPEAGYQSGSGFRDAFARLMGEAPGGRKNGSNGHATTLTAEWIDTRLGPMVAMADSHALRLLEFTDRRGLENEVKRLRQRLRCAIVPGSNAATKQIAKEMTAYFAGKLRDFKTPFTMTGSPFQQEVWAELLRIPSGETRSYRDVAEAVGGAGKVRAVARAVGSNQLAILIPCHRVVGSDGSLTGYAGGLVRKEWLLRHEAK